MQQLCINAGMNACMDVHVIGGGGGYGMAMGWAYAGYGVNTGWIWGDYGVGMVGHGMDMGWIGGGDGVDVG